MRIRYYGHVGQRTGYGVAAQHLCRALARQPEVDLDIFPDFTRFDPELLPEDLRTLVGEAAPRPDVVIVHSLPADCARIRDAAYRDGSLDGAVGRRPVRCVAYTTWEGTTPSPALEDLASFHQIWVPSRPTQKVIRSLWHEGSATAEGVVKVIPHCYDPATYDRPQLPTGLLSGNLTGYRFYWIGAWSQRKNPQGLIRAFAAEFTRADNVSLHLHSSGVAPAAVHMAMGSTGLPSGNGIANLTEAGARECLPRLTFNAEHLSEKAMYDLHRGNDCFVTASRGESWNLPAFEALLAGRHVIAPMHQGSDEFLGLTSANLYSSYETFAYLDAMVVPSGEPGQAKVVVAGASGMTSRTKWLEPNLVHLARAMRDAYTKRTRTIELNANYNLASTFGYDAVAKKALTALQELL